MEATLSQLMAAPLRKYLELVQDTLLLHIHLLLHLTILRQNPTIIPLPISPHLNRTIILLSRTIIRLSLTTLPQNPITHQFIHLTIHILLAIMSPQKLK